jgi:hypothetical protein
MQRAYGGWDSAEARGWNWNQWFAKWRKQLAAKGDMEIPFNEAFAAMDSLIAFQRDNHTQIPLNRRSTIAGSQTAVLARAPSAACAEIRAIGKLFPIAVDDAGQQVRTAKLWKSYDDPGRRDLHFYAYLLWNPTSAALRKHLDSTSADSSCGRNT